MSAPASSRRPAALVDRLLEPASLLTIAVLAVGVGGLFWRWFLAQNEHSWGNDDWSHAYFVPLIGGYILWQRRAGLERTRAVAFWPAIIPLLMGVWTYVYFIAGVPNHFGQGLALVLTIFGLTLLLLGPRAMEHCFTAIAFLVFGITIPEIIMNSLTYPLQDLAATAGHFILRLIGVNADLAGNAITVYDVSTGAPVPLTIAEQCSGMRTVISFLALGATVALVGTRQWWKRVVLVAMAPVVAIGLNASRIAVLGVMSQYNPKFSQGQAHMLIGTLLLVPGFFLYLGVRWSLNMAAPESPPPRTPSKTPRPA
jgi:exosortase